MADAFRCALPKEYYRQFIERDVRPDGRELGEFRPTVLNIGSISTAEGSAIVKLGNTSVICGVKAELAEPKAETPQEGYLVPNVELSALCSSQFRPGPPGEQAQVLSQLMVNIIKNFHSVPLEDLCVVAGKLVWVLYIDLICLDYGGNLIDACVLALTAALKNTALPSISVEEETQKINADITKHNMLQLACTPISASFAIFDNTILLVDPTSEEEALSTGTVTVVTDGEKIFEMDKSGGSQITSEQRQMCFRRAFQRHREGIKLIEDTMSSVDR
ncbi:hypothetical protein C0Q70_05427 [Pomacea canaliculata]|uniref:Ribosomal RNA-processing protein 43 n=1 Tax=Pomacea canaliculata TaxID=400727 RepID=A0A2T7PL87_POMCA|nr:exosome complex component RRP43-like [Pomacea canaliculata]PVD34164.1 hypothetical protein C0Q70_05427 [Pomacea canaliculata]